MAASLLLFVTFLASAWGAVVTIDCDNVNSAINLYDCTASTFQLLTLVSGVLPSTDALTVYFQACPLDTTVVNTITLSGSTCNLDNTLPEFTYDSASFTLTSDPANPTTLTFNTGNYFAFSTENIGITGNTPSADAAFTFSNLILSFPAGGTKFFQSYFGSATFSNVVILNPLQQTNTNPGYYQNGLLYTAIGQTNQASADWPTYNNSLTGITLTADTLNTAHTLYGPIISLGAGTNNVISDVTVSNVNLQTLINVFYNAESGANVQDTYSSVSISNVTFENVHTTLLTCGILLCTGRAGSTGTYSSGFALNDYSIDLSQITVKTSQLQDSSIGLLSYYPDPDTASQTTQTISLRDSVFDGLTFSNINSGMVFAGGSPSLSGNIFSNINQATNIPASASIILADSTYELSVIDNIFVDITGHSAGVLYAGENTIDSLFQNNSFTDCIGAVNVPFVTRGGAILLQGTATISDSVFTGNQANNGGAIYAEGATAYISGNTFENNQAIVQKNYPFVVGYGGAILQNMASSVTIVDSVFSGNNATGSGGAVATVNDRKLATINVPNSENGGDTTFQTCTFTSNNAGAKGGALHFFARNIFVRDSNFTQNTALVGGAVAIDDINPFISSTVDFTNVKFTSNTASGILTNSIFQNGGAVSTVRSARFYKTLFDSNSCPIGSAGALAFYKGGYVEESAFKNNVAGVEGGAIWSLPIQVQNLTVLSTSFEQNSAGTDGGACWIDNPVSLFKTCSFIENSGGNGGAIYFADKGSLDGCGFTSNVASGDGGAVFSNGDTVVSGSRFEENSAANGGAVACYSVPLGSVDFALTLSANTFVNNNASGLGGSVVSTCNTWDQNSNFGPSVQADGSYGVVCPTDQRALRQCELVFTGSNFQESGLQVPQPTATFSSISNGVQLQGVHGTNFDGELAPESLSISDSDFTAFTINVWSPTQVSGTTFTNGTYDQQSGPATFDSCTVDGDITMTGTNDFTFTFTKTEFKSNGGIYLQTNGVFRDVTGTGGAYFQINASASFVRVIVDCESTVEVESDLVIQDDSVIGNLLANSGSVELIGSLTLGGDGCDSESVIAIGFSGSGDFIQAGGTTKWTGGDITGSGGFSVPGGSFLFQSSGVITRPLSFGPDAQPSFSGDPAVNLGTTMTINGGFVLADYSWIRVPAGSSGKIINYGTVQAGRESGMDCDFENYGDLDFTIYDQTDYDSIYFTAGFWSANTTSVNAKDVRQVFYYNADGSQRRPIADYGAKYDIIELSFLWPVDTNGSSPFGSVTYVYGDPSQAIGPSDSHCDRRTCYGPRVTTRLPGDGGATYYLYLFASASTQQISFALLVFFLALSLF